MRDQFASTSNILSMGTGPYEPYDPSDLQTHRDHMERLADIAASRSKTMTQHPVKGSSIKQDHQEATGRDIDLSLSTSGGDFNPRTASKTFSREDRDSLQQRIRFVLREGLFIGVNKRQGQDLSLYSEVTNPVFDLGAPINPNTLDVIPDKNLYGLYIKKGADMDLVASYIIKGLDVDQANEAMKRVMNFCSQDVSLRQEVTPKAPIVSSP